MKCEARAHSGGATYGKQSSRINMPVSLCARLWKMIYVRFLFIESLCGISTSLLASFM